MIEIVCLDCWGGIGYWLWCVFGIGRVLGRRLLRRGGIGCLRICLSKYFGILKIWYFINLWSFKLFWRGIFSCFNVWIILLVDFRGFGLFCCIKFVILFFEVLELGMKLFLVFIVFFNVWYFDFFLFVFFLIFLFLEVLLLWFFFVGYWISVLGFSDDIW